MGFIHPVRWHPPDNDRQRSGDWTSRWQQVRAGDEIESNQMMMAPGGGREEEREGGSSSTSAMEGGNPTLEASVAKVLEGDWVD